MYVLITEYREAYYKDTVTDDEKEAVDDGWLNILDISDPNNIKEYYKGTWEPIEEYRR